MPQPEQIGSIINRVLPIRIVIPGQPATYQRKVGMWHSKDGRSGTNAYPSKSYADWRSYARGRAAEICPGPIPFPDAALPVVLHAWLYFQIPASASHRTRIAAVAHMVRPTKKPDYDNTAKAIADSCLTGIVIRDDRQIVEAHIYKWYDESPRVEIEVRPWVPEGQKGGLFK